jgi:hypothetical protein
MSISCVELSSFDYLRKLTIELTIKRIFLIISVDEP